MIIKSTNITTASKSRAIVHHLIGKTDENDSIEVLFGSRGDVDDAFTNAELSNKKYGVKHFMISNLEEMTDQQFNDAINALSAEFGFSKDNIKLAVIHGKDHHHGDGRHCHFLVETTNPENGLNFDFKNYQQRQELVARTLEMDNGFQLNKGRHNKYVHSRLSESNPEYAEQMKPLTEGRLERKTISEKQIENLRRRGSNPFQMKKELKDLWASSSGDFDKFAEQLAGAGYSIKQGRKTLIINDRDGKFVTGVKNVLNVNDKELSTILESSEYHKENIASHGIEGPEALHTTLEGIANATPSKASQKPQEAHKDTLDTKDQGKAQKAQDIDISSIIAGIDSEKSVATDDMSIEEKQAVSFFNKQESEKDELTKMQLAAQKKLSESMMQKPVIHEYNFYEIWGNWSKYVNNEITKQTDIINQEHPRLKHLDDTEVRSFLYKNFKSELSEFKDRRNALITLRKEIREHDKKSNSITGLYHGYQKNKKEAQEREQMEQLKLLAQYIVDMMLYKMGISKQKPDKSEYLTEAQREAILSKYKRNEYAKLLVEHTNQSVAINSLATMKVYHRDGVLNDFKNRPEADDAREALRKLEKVKNIELSKLNPNEYEQFESHIKDLDVDSVNKIMTEHLMRTRREEREKDKTNAIDDIQENEIEKENPDEIEKNIYRKKMKKSGRSFNI